MVLSLRQMGMYFFLACMPLTVFPFTVLRPTEVTRTNHRNPPLFSTEANTNAEKDAALDTDMALVEALELDYEVPEDAVINIQANAMKRLRELQERKNDGETMVLRMGVRNGGCSGLSYVMDFSTEDEIEEDDAIDDYPSENLKCVVDAKSMLYLYGLELDYSEELIGGGFKFFNPNAEDACGCGSSFGV